MAIKTPGGKDITGRASPCPSCPWRVSQGGKHARETLPSSVQALRTTSWGCHKAPMDNGSALQICAGYLQSKNEIHPAVAFNQYLGHLPVAAHPSCKDPLCKSHIKCDEPLFETFEQMLEALENKNG